MKTFTEWCQLRNESAIPASPTIVARYIRDMAHFGIDRVWPAILQISRSHYVITLPDPTLSYPVTTAINELSRIEPPRSWPAEEKARFLTLPYDIQLTISKREADRDKQIRQMQNEFAALKKESDASTKTTAA